MFNSNSCLRDTFFFNRRGKESNGAIYSSVRQSFQKRQPVIDKSGKLGVAAILYKNKFDILNLYNSHSFINTMKRRYDIGVYI